MKLTRRLTAFAIPFLTSLAFAGQTWIVDDNGGAGVDFTSLTQAVSSVAPGDVLIVRAGNYAGFTLSQPLTMLFDNGARATFARFDGIVTGTTVIAGMSCADVDVTFCTAPVIFDTLNADANVLVSNVSPVLYVGACADVRFHRCAIAARSQGSNPQALPGRRTAQVVSSRVEFTRSSISGGDAGWFTVTTMNAFYGSDGGIGLECDNSSLVYLAQSGVSGGWGEDADAGYGAGDCVGGDGAPAILLTTGARLTIAGRPQDGVLGGEAGYGYIEDGDSAPAIVFHNTCHIRHSGATVAGGTGAVAFAGNQSLVTLAVPPDPTIALVGNPTPGAPVSVEFTGVVGLNGRLQLGNQPLLVVDGLALIPQLTNRIRIYPLGTVPASGTISYPMVVPTNWQTGALRMFQGLEVDTSNGTLVARTNSLPVVVR